MNRSSFVLLFSLISASNVQSSSEQVAVKCISSHMLKSGIDISLFTIEEYKTTINPLVILRLQSWPRAKRSLNEVDVLPAIVRAVLIGFFDKFIDNMENASFNLASLAVTNGCEYAGDIVGSMCASLLAFMQASIVYGHLAIQNPLNFRGRDVMLALCEIDGALIDKKNEAITKGRELIAKEAPQDLQPVFHSCLSYLDEQGIPYQELFRLYAKKNVPGFDWMSTLSGFFINRDESKARRLAQIMQANPIDHYNNAVWSISYENARLIANIPGLVLSKTFATLSNAIAQWHLEKKEGLFEFQAIKKFFIGLVNTWLRDESLCNVESHFDPVFMALGKRFADDTSCMLIKPYLRRLNRDGIDPLSLIAEKRRQHWLISGAISAASCLDPRTLSTLITPPKETTITVVNADECYDKALKYYENANGKEESLRLAVYCAKMAENKGSAYAQVLLGLLNQDSSTREDYYKKAYYNPNANDAVRKQAAFNLGLFYKQLGRRESAALWFNRAMEHGHPGAQIELNSIQKRPWFSW